MKLYRFTVGYDEKFHPFESEEEAYERRAEVDHTFEWLPVSIEEIAIPGFTITVTKDEGGHDESNNSVPGPFDGWDKVQLKTWLDERGIQYTPQLGEQKLRELALKHV